jgi:hypothetical protein
MKQNLYSIVVVFFRLGGVSVILFGLYLFLVSVVVGLSVGRLPVQMFTAVPLILSVAAGIVLWLIARPVAWLVTADLD